MARQGVHGTFFLYRVERLPNDVFRAADFDYAITETGRRRWRIHEGDHLVFIEGKGLALQFVAIAPVRGVTVEEIEEDDLLLVRVTVIIGEPSKLPPELTLEGFMYSLTLISNFSRPWNHVRHRGRLPAVDVETLQEQRIIWHRTVFFGLLRELPDRWRDMLELESRALRAATRLERGIERWGAFEPEPVTELLSLIDDSLLEPTRLATEVQSSWQELFGTPNPGDIAIVESDGTTEPWNFVEFLRQAPRAWRTMLPARSTVQELPWQETRQEEQLKWRPHRW